MKRSDRIEIAKTSSGKSIYSYSSKPSDVLYSLETPHGFYHIEDHGAGSHFVFFTGKRCQLATVLSCSGSFDKARNSIDWFNARFLARGRHFGGVAPVGPVLVTDLLK